MPTPTTTTPTTLAAETSTSTASFDAPSQTEYDTPEGAVGLICEGSGPVPIVLMAGGDDPPSVWDGIVRALGDRVLTCRFDPSAIDTDITATRRSDALSVALERARLSPAVLVGHSLAGLTIRAFGNDHPEQLAGVVLLDPTTPASLRDFHDELAAIGWDVEQLQADADAEVAWPGVPVRVLSHDPVLLTLGSEDLEAAWTEGQEAYAALSKLGTYAHVPESGHFVHVDAPEAVVAAITDVIGAITGG
jgi:pimeloyl-ACP methyl ester carboxylesterase